MPNIPTPRAATASKTHSGDHDVSLSNGVLKFMGCSIINVTATNGYNTQPSSVSVTLVEDIENGDSFVSPDIPSIWAICLPEGGIGKPVVGPSLDIGSVNYYPNKFYFCGVCTSWSQIKRDAGGRTISINLVDPRELLSGVQCLMSGFSLSQNIGSGSSRYSNVENVIDVFGYYNYGMESDKNEFGMTWNKIKQVIESVRVSINDLWFEFRFTHSPFVDSPSWYRLDNDVIDLMSLVQKVSNDGGSDFVCIARKIGNNGAVVEFRGIRRTNKDPLTKTELTNFVNNRTSIVSNYRIGKEYRNEYTSNIILGGLKNKNYVALPSIPYHNTLAEWNAIKFDNISKNKWSVDNNGNLTLTAEHVVSSDSHSSGYYSDSKDYQMSCGSIFPFWGFAPQSTEYPLLEPFLPLEHLVFDSQVDKIAGIKNKIPNCRVAIKNLSVRQRSHDTMFLSYDADSDDRPVAVIDSVVLSDTKPDGYIRGLPLNANILAAAIASKEAFMVVYYYYYPEISERLNLLSINLDELANEDISNIKDISRYIHLNKLLLKPTLDAVSHTKEEFKTKYLDTIKYISAWIAFHDVLYQKVKEYAMEHFGKRFLVYLPKSNIMQRIWAGLSVPTRKEKPEIEYVIDNLGFWEDIPEELDELASYQSEFTSPQESDIRKRFMSEDGRFYAMVAIDKYPVGLFNTRSNSPDFAGNSSNKINRVMLQDLPIDDFRPNRIAETSTNSYVFSSCSVTKASDARPDLAIVTMPGVIRFDPNDLIGDDVKDTKTSGSNPESFKIYDEDAIDFLIRLIYSCPKLLEKISKTPIVTSGGKIYTGVRAYAELWAPSLRNRINAVCVGPGNYEYLLDLKGIIIPLTSTWVTYGPWYATSDDAKGKVNIEKDDSLVPWNFVTPNNTNGWRSELDDAGKERLARTISVLDYVDNASITVAGFPEFPLANSLGFNSNLTGMSIEYSAGGVRTTYNFATYNAKPGTFRKSDFDNLSKTRLGINKVDVIPDNLSLLHNNVYTGSNQFGYIK